MAHFHLVGIGGAGMSGLARILRAQGQRITGSDATASPITTKLRQEKFPIQIGPKPKPNFTDKSVIIHSTAVPQDHPELRLAHARHLKILSYPAALGLITQGKKVLAVAGTHGKSTTTGLIIAGLKAAQIPFSCLVGTNLPELNQGNAQVANAEIFVLEACEYQAGFLHLTPEIIALTNLEAEHLDYFQNFTNYLAAFQKLVQKIPAQGFLIAAASTKNLPSLRSLAPHFWNAEQANLTVSLQIPGAMNRCNAQLALAVAQVLKIDLAKFQQGLAKFTGGERRLELKGQVKGALIFDDYAHHPTEIQALLQAAREKFPTKKIVLVYQQHQLDRVNKFFEPLVASLALADVVVIPNFYLVREEQQTKTKITPTTLVRALRQKGTPAFYEPGFPKTIQWLQKNLNTDSIALITGAGDIYKITSSLLQKSSN